MCLLLDVPCKQGQLQITEAGSMCVLAPLGETVWSISVASVTGFTTRPGEIMTVNVLIHSEPENQYVEMLTKQNFAKLQALFPRVPTTVVAGAQWYYDTQRLTHVVEYEDMEEMRNEVALAAEHGWMPDNIDKHEGSFSTEKAFVGELILGPIGLLAGALGDSEKRTITFVRTPEWIAHNHQ